MRQKMFLLQNILNPSFQKTLSEEVKFTKSQIVAILK